MAYDSRKNGLRRQEAVGMEELVAQFIRDMKLSSGLDVSFDRGVMVCVISSSVVRNQLYFRREKLLKSLNEHLASDALLAGSAEGDIVKTLILR